MSVATTDSLLQPLFVRFTHSGSVYVKCCRCVCLVACMYMCVYTLIWFICQMDSMIHHIGQLVDFLPKTRH